VVNELLLLKARARKEQGQIAVFFIDDNFAINVRRTKSLLRDIIAAKAQVFWVAQISANLLRDEELIDLIADSGGKWIFIGMESVDPVNLKDMNKGFNKPSEYAAVLERLAKRNIYAITSFIFGMDNDTPGVAERTLQQVRTWPPGLPVFGLLTPLPATPLYKRLEAAGRLTRPRHWKDFLPFTMAHTPLKMTIEEAHAELNYGWAHCYSPEAMAQAVAALDDQHLGDRLNVFLAAGRGREPPNDPEAFQRGSVSMDAPSKFCQPGYLWRRNAQCQHLNRFPGEQCTRPKARLAALRNTSLRCRFRGSLTIS
jgi:radical SAM superfamily enzyme YgiQ (UPF0313 family)